MNPIQNQSFNHDYLKFVYQNPDVRVVHYEVIPTKPFKVEGPDTTKRTKKDLKKEKDQEGKKEPDSGQI